MIRAKAIVKYLGYILLFNALFLFISAAISFAEKEESLNALLVSAVLIAIVGAIPLLFVGKIGEIKFHEGLAISILGWVFMCLAGMMPYCLWGSEFTLANALFESVSGYTTTGSSILGDVEALPDGILFWRSSTSLIGGLGIILFVLLVLPEKRGSMSSFYRVEVSELAPLLHHTAPLFLYPVRNDRIHGRRDKVRPGLPFLRVVTQPTPAHSPPQWSICRENERKDRRSRH